MRALLAGLLAALPATAHAEWWLERAPCPGGTKLTGAAGADVSCQDASGTLHGRRTRWFPGAGKREEGGYRRGVAHGKWTWWKKDGRKALEGEYWAGKKTGKWTRWDDKGKAEVSEHPKFEQSDAAIDAAIAEALKGAGSRTIDSSSAAGASTGTGGGTGGGSGDDLGGARGSGEAAEAIVTQAAVGGGRAQDISDVDMGKAHFDNGGGEEASSYIKKAVAKAGGVVDRCYRAAKKKTKAEIVVRWAIDGGGRVTDVRIVKSTLTGDVSDCIKKGILKLELEPHDEREVEVISPWRLVPPR